MPSSILAVCARRSRLPCSPPSFCPSSVAAERLPQDRRPRSLRPGVHDRPEARAVQRPGNDPRARRRADLADRAERGRSRPAGRHDRDGGVDAEGDRVHQPGRRDRDAHRAAADRAGRGGHPHPLQRRPEHQAARLVSEQDGQAQVRRDAVRSDRRAAGLSRASTSRRSRRPSR